MDAVLASAATLFAKRGPAAVSMREIAAASRVNHALIHRHFRTKDDLVRAVLDRAAQKLTAALRDVPSLRGEIPRLMRASRAVEAEWHTLAHAVLSGSGPREIRGPDPPLATQLVRLLAAERTPGGDIDARVAAAALLAFIVGWLSFGDFALALSGRRAPARANAQVDRLLEAMTERALRGRPARVRSGRAGRRAGPRG